MKKLGVKSLWVLVLVLCWIGFSAETGFAQADAQGGVFDVYEIQPGGKLEIPVEIHNVEDLYAIDIEIRFDPDVIQFEDADPKTEGIQPALGTFLDAGMVLYNTIDNSEGVIRFVMTQVNPSEGKTGDGVILVLYAIGLVEGESPLTISFLELANRAGEAVTVEPVDAEVIVSSDALMKETTPISVQDSSGMISVPTLQSTETPKPEASEPAENSVDLSDDSKNEGVDQDLTENQQETSSAPSDDVQSEFILLRYWWAVAIVVVVVIGLAVYLLATRK